MKFEERYSPYVKVVLLAYARQRNCATFVVGRCCRKSLRTPANSDSGDSVDWVMEAGMMGRRSDQGSLFYQFRLDERVPKGHLLRDFPG